MKTLEIIAAGRLAIEAITGAKAEVMSRCERRGDAWAVTAEVVETKARIADNDLMASYLLIIDDGGELTSYERTRRYVRARSLDAA